MADANPVVGLLVMLVTGAALAGCAMDPSEHIDVDGAIESFAHDVGADNVSGTVDDTLEVTVQADGEQVRTYEVDDDRFRDDEVETDISAVARNLTDLAGQLERGGYIALDYNPYAERANSVDAVLSQAEYANLRERGVLREGGDDPILAGFGTSVALLAGFVALGATAWRRRSR